MRVAIVLTTPPDTYSGGRYNGFMLAEALAAAGHESFVISDNEPIFLKDLALLPDHKNVRFCRTSNFRSGMPEGAFDIVVLIPGTSKPGFYLRVQLFALERGAHLVFFNFESPNWYNSLAPVPRPPGEWASWARWSRHASLILANSKESMLWARRFYKPSSSRTRFDFAYPSINTAAADMARVTQREKRLLLFMRFTSSSHKGSDNLRELFCESMRGYTLVIVLGKEDISPRAFRELLAEAKAYDVQVELRHKLNDVEKFLEIKRARLLLFPSLFEGFGYPPVEALYCATPCVAFDLPVLRETCNDHLVYAEHGNWEEFRAKIVDILDAEPQEMKTRAEMESLASPAALGKRLEAVFTDLLKEPPVDQKNRAWRKRWLTVRSVLGLSDPALRYRSAGTFARRLVRKTARRLLRGVQQRRKGRRRVVYFPPFDSVEALSDHYYRACWYLPRVAGTCEEVCLFHTIEGPDVGPGALPEHMGFPEKHPEHIRIRRGRLGNYWKLFSADLVLLWRENPSPRLFRFLDVFFGITSLSIATDDPSAMEFDRYCRLVWEWMTPEAERKSTIEENRLRFQHLHTEISGASLKASCVFGTGPSLEKIDDFDFSDTLCIVCNSAVQDDRLLDHLAPRFVCAGDAVSHFGVSAYAYQFRHDLIRALTTRDLYLLTTAKVGALLLYHHPELADRVFLIEQTRDAPTFDLSDGYETARMDSTLNIHMLPLASTFSRNVFLLGCDGKNPGGGNEDFWAHAGDAQYHGLVDTGHECHPTFDLLRQRSTYEKYLRSLEATVTGGEQRGIQYHSLHASFTATLDERTVSRRDMEKCGLRRPYRIAELAQRLYGPRKENP